MHHGLRGMDAPACTAATHAFLRCNQLEEPLLCDFLPNSRCDNRNNINNNCNNN